jgi:hypothetical protein
MQELERLWRGIPVHLPPYKVPLKARFAALWQAKKGATIPMQGTDV